MKKLLAIIVLGLWFSGNAYANVQVLECKQIVEINDDIGEDLIIKRTVKINFDSKSINSYYPDSTKNTSYEISNVTDVSIEAIRKPKLDNGIQSLSLNRYTLELKYHFYNENSVYQGASTFECNKLEKKI